MTEQELQAIEDAWNEGEQRVRAGDTPDPVRSAGIIVRAPALVAEVRRLRAALEAADAHMRRWSDARSGSSAETHAACEAWAIITKALAVPR